MKKPWVPTSTQGNLSFPFDLTTESKSPLSCWKEASEAILYTNTNP